MTMQPVNRHPSASDLRTFAATVIRALPTIVRAFSLGFQQMFHPHAHADAVPRTDRDLKMSTVLTSIALCTVAIGVFFFFAHPGGHGGEGLVLSTAEFWLKLGAAYALVAALVGAAALAFRLVRG